MTAVLPDGLDELLPRLLLFGQMKFIKAFAVAFIPGRCELLAQPVGHDGGERIQGMTQCLAHDFQLVQLTHDSQNGCGVSALLSPGFQPAACLQTLQQCVQEDLACATIDQTRAKFTQHRVVKAGIGEV